MSRFSLTALLGLNSQAFQNGLANAQTSVGAFRGALTRLAPVLASVGLTQMARSAIDTGSRLSDLAVQVNINAEALQALSFSAQTAGVGQSTLQRALRNVQLRTEEAIIGNQSYADAFERLGINIEEFRRLPTEEKFNTIARAQADATDKQSAFNAVARILGERAGPELQEVLQDVAENGFDSLKESARDAGQLMSTQTMVAMDNTSDRIAELKTQATNLVAEGLNRLIGAFDMTKEALRMVGLQFAAGISTVIEFGSTLVNIISNSLQPATTAFGALVEAGRAVGQALSGNFREAGESIDRAQELAGQALNEFMDIPSAIGDEFSAMGDRLSDMNRNIERDMEDAAKNVEEGFVRMTTGVVTASEGVGNQVATNVTPNLSAAFSNANDVAGAIGGIKTSADNAGQSIEELNAQRLDSLSQEAQSVQGQIEEVEGKIRQTRQAILDLNTSELDELLQTFGATASEMRTEIERQLQGGQVEAHELSSEEMVRLYQTALNQIRQRTRSEFGELGEGVRTSLPDPETILRMIDLMGEVSREGAALADIPDTVQSLEEELRGYNRALEQLQNHLEQIELETLDITESTNELSTALATKATEISNIEIPDALGNVGDGTGGTGGLDLNSIGSKLDMVI